MSLTTRQGNAMESDNYGTIWVCLSCLLHHANGECGDCHSEEGHEEEPLGDVQAPFYVTMGMVEGDHEEDCLTYILADLTDRFPDIDWPDLPGDYECDCETDTFSTSSCEGCGSYLYGERHAMTLFKR